MGDTCERCGRDLKSLGVYRDYIHYILGTGTPCLPLDQYTVEVCRVLAESVFEKFKGKVDMSNVFD
jgi:hypothetical protein